MAEDWIARGLAGIATIAAVVNSYISYRKLQMDREKVLPPMSWRLSRPKPREIKIEATIKNDRSGTIEVKDFFVGNIPGARVQDLSSNTTDYPNFSGMSFGPKHMSFVGKGAVPPGEDRSFMWLITIDDAVPAPKPVGVDCWLNVDLGDGSARDQRFRLKRKV